MFAKEASLESGDWDTGLLGALGGGERGLNMVKSDGEILFEIHDSIKNKAKQGGVVPGE